MLHALQSVTAYDRRNASELAPVAIAKFPAADLSVVAFTQWEPAARRYGEKSGANGRALVLTVLVHLIVIALLLGTRHHSDPQKEERLVTVNLTPPPSPPPAPPPDTTTPKQAAIIAPRPAVQIDLPQQINVPVAADPQPIPLPVPETQASSTSSSSAAAPPSVVQGGDLGARMVSGKPPRYPTESRRKREQGTVVLALVLGLDGAVEQISVSSSSGFERLDRAALDAVRRWRWEPISRGGQPVKIRGSVEIPFVLQG